MSLITNNKGSVYNGINQQSAEYRLDSQAEEMINAYPTLDQGLLKRNPTIEVEADHEPTYRQNVWSYEYDRGLSGSKEETYSIYITDEGMEIIDIRNGKTYNFDNGGIEYEDYVDASDQGAKAYLEPFISRNGYAATTVKDVTFIANKNRIPKLLDAPAENTGTSVTYQRARIPIFAQQVSAERQVTRNRYDCDDVIQSVDYIQSEYMAKVFERYEPVDADGLTGSSCRVERTDRGWGSASIAITVDTFDVPIVTEPALGSSFTLYTPRTVDDILSDLADVMETSLADHGFNVYRNSGFIHIVREDALNTTPIVVSVNVTFGDAPHTGCTQSSTCLTRDSYYTESVPTTSNFFGTVLFDSVTSIEYEASSYYKQAGYIWIKSSDPVYGYDYGCSIDIKKPSGSIQNLTITGITATKTSVTAATNLAANINAHVDLTATSDGSVIQIRTADADDEIYAVNANDSYGNAASFGFAQRVRTVNDLPKNIGTYTPIVKVVDGNEEAAFWLKYEEGTWLETVDPDAIVGIDASTMPHVIERKSDGSGFLVRKHTDWGERTVGDDTTNEPPFIFSSDENTSPKIKDIFFFKNRLGFIIKNAVVLSEVGEYGNFWRTSVMTLLDSDPINTTVDSTKALNLEYAVYFEDSIMLFSSKEQFRLRGGDILSPKNIQIGQTSAYEINRSVRPLNMNNRIFFAAKRGGYTAVIEYYGSKTSPRFETNDITAHCQTYIDGDITKITGSPVNNMLFISSATYRNLIYVYKYYDSGDKRVQSAWFKWQFNGDIYFIFAFDRRLYIAIARYTPPWVLDENAEWDMDGEWSMTAKWVMSAADLTQFNFFEYMNIVPQSYLEDFTDNSGDIVASNVRLGEWVLSANGNRDIRGHLKYKTIEVSSEDDSVFYLTVDDINRGSSRNIPSNLTVERKPLVFGDAKNVRVSIKSDSNYGFRINMVSLEGRISNRARRI